MRLEAVYGGDADTAGAGLSAARGVVQISAAKQRLIGVRTDLVRRAPRHKCLRQVSHRPIQAVTMIPRIIELSARHRLLVLVLVFAARYTAGGR